MHAIYRISDGEFPLARWMFAPRVHGHERPVVEPLLRMITRSSWQQLCLRACIVCQSVRRCRTHNKPTEENNSS